MVVALIATPPRYFREQVHSLRPAEDNTISASSHICCLTGKAQHLRQLSVLRARFLAVKFLADVHGWAVTRGDLRDLFLLPCTCGEQNISGPKIVCCELLPLPCA